jgi:hyperosmotically inducible periplasmic protein
MDRKILTQHALTAALAAALGVTGAASAASQGETADPRFNQLDTNRDGYLSREEAGKVRGFDKAFGEADENRDGKLDAAEFVKAQATHERMTAGRYVDDSVITAKVKAALLKDPNVSGLAVSVETHKGTVVLSGFVDSDNQLRRAQEIAAGVQGVVSVKNGLVVKS